MQARKGAQIFIWASCFAVPVGSALFPLSER